MTLACELSPLSLQAPGGRLNGSVWIPSIQTCRPSVLILRPRMEEGSMYIGVDTHKKAHVLVAIDDQGQTGGTHTMANIPSGWAAALCWAHALEATSIWPSVTEDTVSLVKS